MKTAATELVKAKRDNARMKAALNKVIRYCSANQANWINTVNNGGTTSISAILDALDIIGHHAEAALLPAPKVAPLVKVACAGGVWEGNIINSTPVSDRPDYVTIKVYEIGQGDAGMTVTGPVVEGKDNGK